MFTSLPNRSRNVWSSQSRFPKLMPPCHFPQVTTARSLPGPPARPEQGPGSRRHPAAPQRRGRASPRPAPYSPRRNGRAPGRRRRRGAGPGLAAGRRPGRVAAGACRRAWPWPGYNAGAERRCAGARALGARETRPRSGPRRYCGDAGTARCADGGAP